MSTDGSSQGLRVAIVGVGPKGLFALERLLHYVAARPGGGPVAVDLFEPHEAPGAGPVYALEQPSYLRINLAAEYVDLWGPTNAAVPAEHRRSLVSWMGTAVPLTDEQRYPPRAVLGHYLTEGLDVLLRHVPDGLQVTLRRARVHAVLPERDGWTVQATDGGGSYDEVLLATGHRDAVDEALAEGLPGTAPLVPAVFPTSRWLGPERISPQATVAVRGFALTFHDAALALTEGRGGTFVPSDDQQALRYVPGTEEVGRLLPFARAGRPMLTKPDPGVAAAARGLEAIAEHGRAQIDGLPDPIALQTDLLPILAATATASLRATGESSAELGRMLAWCVAAASGSLAQSSGDVVERLRQSLAVARGLARPDEDWALGHTWRTLYPAIVRRLEGDGLPTAEWPAFRRLAAEMERVAFGPSPLNSAKLLALIAAGKIDLRHVAGGRLMEDRGRMVLRSTGGADPIDVLLDAVLPAPGVDTTDEHPLAALLRAGAVQVPAGRRGIAVDAAAQCLGHDGALTPGLSAVGRPTEDVVVGNDTLSRALHPQIDRWAQRMVERTTTTAPIPDEPQETHA